MLIIYNLQIANYCYTISAIPATRHHRFSRSSLQMNPTESEFYIIIDIGLYSLRVHIRRTRADKYLKCHWQLK